MPKGPADDFTPVKFETDFTLTEGRFYIYAIWNIEKDKYYIGISGHPLRRINEQLKKKSGLKKDFARSARAQIINPQRDLMFRFGLLGRKDVTGEPLGYPNAFLGCIAEVMQMIKLESQGITLYNQNKFGGHPALDQKRHAFETIVKIIDPALRGHASDDDMRALEDHIHEIRDFVQDSGGLDIIGQDFLEELDKAWDDYLERKKRRGFGRNQAMPIIAFGEDFTPLRVASNDNKPSRSAPKPYTYEEMTP